MEEIIAAPHHETARGQVPFSSTHRLQMGDQPKSGADSRSTHVQACWSDHTSRGWSFWVLNHLLFMLNLRTSCFFHSPQLQAHYLGHDIMLAFEEDVGSILAQAPKYSEAIHLADEHLQLQPLLPTGLRFLWLCQWYAEPIFMEHFNELSLSDLGKLRHANKDSTGFSWPLECLWTLCEVSSLYLEKQLNYRLSCDIAMSHFDAPCWSWNCLYYIWSYIKNADVMVVEFYVCIVKHDV